MSPHDALVSMLEQIAAVRGHNPPPGMAYASIEQFVLRNGVRYEPALLPEPYRYGEPKHCFMNAYQLAEAEPDLRYVEGYALGVIPVLHAWIVDSRDRVIDTTWRPETTPIEERAYLGVPLLIDLVRATILYRGKYGVLDDWEHDWPLLQQPYDPDVVLIRAKYRAAMHLKWGLLPREEFEPAESQGQGAKNE